MVVAGRFVFSPALNLPIMYVFGFRGVDLKILVMQAMLPQGISSFVVFKEFKTRPDVLCTSLVLGTLACLPATCIWYFIMETVVGATHRPFFWWSDPACAQRLLSACRRETEPLRGAAQHPLGDGGTSWLLAPAGRSLSIQKQLAGCG